MFERVLKLFRKDQEAAERSQAQREAFIDLLVWTMFVDRHLASVEAEQIRKEAQGLQWEGRPLERFMDASVKRTRDILGSENAERAYLDDIHGRLGDAEMRLRVLGACEELIAIDGERADAEVAHLERVKARFAAESPGEVG